MANPYVTVFIPVYNGAAYLVNAIESILNQDFHDFELLIIDDGSTDHSTAIIESYVDSRIRNLKNETNKGISFTRNRAVKEARGRLFALLDADDIACPDRLRKQVGFFENNPEVVACGSHAQIIDANGMPTGKFLRVPTHKDEIKARLVFQNVFVNSTVMYRLDVLQKTNGYYDDLCEDYEMAVQLNLHYALANIDEVLVQYRVHPTSTTFRFAKQMANAEKKVIEIIHQQLGIEKDLKLISTHHAIVSGNEDAYLLDDYAYLFLTLKKANNNKAIYPQLYFDKLLFMTWYTIIRVKGSRSAFFEFFKKPLFQWRFVSFKMIRKIIKQSFWLKK